MLNYAREEELCRMQREDELSRRLWMQERQQRKAEEWKKRVEEETRQREIEREREWQQKRRQRIQRRVEEKQNEIAKRDDERAKAAAQRLVCGDEVAQRYRGWASHKVNIEQNVCVRVCVY